MDNSEHIAWVGNIFQKFEAMYLEVDDIMRQELQAVGANVKKFCSDLMQDVLPPSSVDTTEEADPDLYLLQNTDLFASKKYDVGMEEDHSEDELLHSSSVETVEFIQLSPDQSFDVGMNGSSEVRVHENPVKENQLQLEMSDTDNLGEKNSNVTLSSSATNDATHSKSPPKFFDLVESCESELQETPVPYLIRYMTKSDEDGLDLYNEYANSLSSYSDRSDDFVAEEVSHNDVTKLDLGVIQPLDSIKFDESCILVDSSEFSSVSAEVGLLMSYKKTFPKAFAAKLGLRGQRYMQHASTCENLDAIYNQDKGNGSMKPSIPTCKSDSEFSESDWEIV